MTQSKLDKDDIGAFFLPIKMKPFVAIWPKETRLLVFEKPQSDAEYEYKGFYRGGEGSVSHADIQALADMGAEKEYIWIMNYSPCNDCTTKIKGDSNITIKNLHIFFAGQYGNRVAGQYIKHESAFKELGIEPLNLPKWIGFILWNLTDLNDEHLIEVLQRKENGFPDVTKDRLERCLDLHKIKVRKYKSEEYYTSKEVVKHRQDADDDAWKVCTPQRLNKNDIGELFLPILMKPDVAICCNETHLLVFEKPQSDAEYKYKKYYKEEQGPGGHAEAQALGDMNPKTKYIWIMNYSPCDDCTTKIKEKFHGDLQIYFAGQYNECVSAFKELHIDPLHLGMWIGFILWNLTDLNDDHVIQVLTHNKTVTLGYSDELKKKILETILDRYEIKVKKYQSEVCWTSEEVVQHRKGADDDALKAYTFARFGNMST